MNIHDYSLQYLEKYGQVLVPGFGIFTLKNTPALWDEKGSQLLPPRREIIFEETESASGDLAKYIAAVSGLTFDQAETDIENEIKGWQKSLSTQHEFQLTGFGKLSRVEGKLHFTAAQSSPEYYGLEEINLTDIKKSKKEEDAPYRFSKMLWWLLPLLAAGAVLLYVGLTQPEVLFGERTKALAPEPKITPPPVLPKPAQSDSAAVKTDSLQGQTNPVNTP